MPASNLWRRGVVVTICVERFVCRQEGNVRLGEKLHDIKKSEGLGRFLADGFEARLEGSDFLGLRGGEIVLLVWIFGKVVELDVGWQYRAPD